MTPNTKHVASPPLRSQSMRHRTRCCSTSIPSHPAPSLRCSSTARQASPIRRDSCHCHRSTVQTTMFICGFLLASTMIDGHWTHRCVRVLKCSLMLHLLLAATCRGFFQNLATSRNRHGPYSPINSIGFFSSSSSSSSTTAFVDQCHGIADQQRQKQQQQQQHLSIAALLTSSSTTRLYESSSSNSAQQQQEQQQEEQQRKKKKPPRFVQKVHAKKQNFRPIQSSSSENTGGTRRRQPQRRRGPLPPGMPSTSWNADRSIEELEDVMLKRWGTLESSSLASNTKTQKNSRNTNGKRRRQATTNPFQRPVLDPWAQEDGDDDDDEKDLYVREFYDEDDEGFEILELDQDDEEGYSEWEDGAEGSDRNPRMKISHLMSPKPVGGRGTNQNPVDYDVKTTTVTPKSTAAESKSYFFNPNKQIQQPADSPFDSKNGARSDKKNEGETGSSNTSTKTRDQPPPPAKAILDQDGSPVLLTTEEALHRFQASTDDDGAVAAMTMTSEDESPDSPMVTYQQQQEKDTAPSSWDNMGITSDILLENLNAMYCSAPLSVQEKAIPAVLTGNDVLVGTYTGSGKTLAFLVPLVQRLLWSSEDLGLTVVIVAPGRELASQIVSVARQLLEDTQLKVQLAIGGTTFSRNLEQIRKQKPNIIVGTPGRIAELVVGKPGEKSGRLKIGNLQTLVLDEFDALLEYKPHREPTRAILQTLQRRHGESLQSILCSATASDLMDSPKVTEYLRPGFATAMADENDAFVTRTQSKPRPQVSRTVMHGVVHVPHRRFVLDTIRRILHTEPIPQQILIFVESARKVDVVIEKLAERGIIAAPLHGGQGSDKMDRAEVSKALREGYVGIVVATELAARGLDASLLTHVINLDLPTDASHYAHRAGRCGRGGRPGVVINITTSPKERNVPQRFATSLGIEMHTVEPRQGRLVLVDHETQALPP